MKHILLITLLLSLGCSSTQRQNRQLRLSKEHLLKALSLGAVLDSTKTTLKENITVSGIHDVESKEKTIDINDLDSLCSELEKRRHFMNGGFSVAEPYHTGQGEFYNTPYIEKITKQIQKTVCPNEKKDTVYHQKIIIDGKEYDNPIHLIASSIDGHASLQVDAKRLTIPYVKETVQVNATPANLPTWWQRLRSNLSLFLLGALAGAVSMLVIGIVKKVVKLGI